MNENLIVSDLSHQLRTSSTNTSWYQFDNNLVTTCLQPVTTCVFLRPYIVNLFHTDHIIITIFLQALSGFIKIKPRRSRSVLVDQCIFLHNEDPVRTTTVRCACFVRHRIHIQWNGWGEQGTKSLWSLDTIFDRAVLSHSVVVLQWKRTEFC